MTQTRLESLIETLINIAIGILIGLSAQVLIFPMYGINVPLKTNLVLSMWFTAIAIVRGYVIRRWFNARLHKVVHAITKAAS